MSENNYVSIGNNEDQTLLGELRDVCRDQLHKYPKVDKRTMKQQIKYMVNAILNRKGIDVDKFFWPNGLLAIALEQSYKYSKDKRDFESLVSYFDKWIESGLKIYNLDNTINGYSMIYVYEKTKELKYKAATEKLFNYLYNHPKDQNGSLPYRTKYYEKNSSDNIFIDSMGMICPFLCRYGKLTGDNRPVDLATEQLLNFLKYGFDDKKCLPYHAYNLINKYKLGIIGWGRSLGWLMIGMIDSLEYIDSSHKDYKCLCDSFEKLVKTSIKYQHNDGYFSWQLEAIEGPIDTSTTSMITYAIRKGIKIGVVEKSYLHNTSLAVSALKKSIDGGIVKDSSAECQGLSMYPQIYDSYPWAQGPTTALFAISLE